MAVEWKLVCLAVDSKLANPGFKIHANSQIFRFFMAWAFRIVYDLSEN